MPIQIEQFMCRSDNFCVLIHDPNSGLTASIDAPNADIITEQLEKHHWSLTHIFTTHHHGDHIEGNAQLKERYQCEIIGPAKEAAKITSLSRSVNGGDAFIFGQQTVHVIDTPGHTLGQIAYHMPDAKVLFAADCLFSLGCGRIFEGTPEMMWESLSRLAALPDDTMLYCGHEYSAANARFALSIEPENEALQARVAEIHEQIKNGHMTLPISLGSEKATNPFLRPHAAEICANLNMVGASDAQVFAELRKRKDTF